MIVIISRFADKSFNDCFVKEYWQSPQLRYSYVYRRQANYRLNPDNAGNSIIGSL